MEVLNLIRLFWGWFFPCISRKPYSLYRWGIRYLKSWATKRISLFGLTTSSGFSHRNLGRHPARWSNAETIFAGGVGRVWRWFCWVFLLVFFFGICVGWCRSFFWPGCRLIMEKTLYYISQNFRMVQGPRVLEVQEISVHRNHKLFWFGPVLFSGSRNYTPP